MMASRHHKRPALFSVCLVLCVFCSSLLAAQGELRGSSLRWKTTTLQISVASTFGQEASSVKPGSDVQGAIRRSLESWQNVTNVDFELLDSSIQNVSGPGARGDGVSLITIAPTTENLLLFSKDLKTLPATTRIFYDRRGFITEADIVLNPYQQFSTDGSLGTYDLEATLAHEIGHLLGLDHSGVLGATMHEKIGKNGSAGAYGIQARRLSHDDIAAIRQLYGAPIDSECCGAVSGRLTIAAAKKPETLDVWVEETGTGRVFAKSRTAEDGSFKIGGLDTGSYSVYAQGAKAVSIGTRHIGDALIAIDANDKILKSLQRGRGNVQIQLIGLNSQLSELAVSLNRGETYRLFAGGVNLDPKQISIGFSSPNFAVTPGTIAAQDFGESISVVSFEVLVDPQTPPGEYSIFVESAAGERRSLIGAIVVE